MAAKKEIHEFAVRWYEKFHSPKTSERRLKEGFSEECFALGFEMDCGKSFESAFPGMNAFNDADALYEIIDQIQDVHLLGLAIFSQWRYVTHLRKERIAEVYDLAGNKRKNFNGR